MNDLLALALTVGLLLLAVVGLVVGGAVILVIAMPVTIAWVIFYRLALGPEAREREQAKVTWQLYIQRKSEIEAVSFPELMVNKLPDDWQDITMAVCTRTLYLEGLHDYPPEPPKLCNTVEGGRYRDALNRTDANTYRRAIDQIIQLGELCTYKQTRNLAHNLLLHCCEGDFGRPLLPVTAKQVTINVERIGCMPDEYKGDDVFGDYFYGTAIPMLKEIVEEVEIDPMLRFENHHIIARPGQGKTQCLQDMILTDLESDAAVIVLDSQGEMIEKLLHVVPPERLVLIDPTDLEFPPALNVFDIGDVSSLEDEQKISTSIDLYAYMFSALNADLTSKQDTLYRYICRLLVATPGATIMDMLYVIEDGVEKYPVSKLPEIPRRFFSGQFHTDFKDTRKELARRIYQLLDIGVFQRMFTAPEHKVDIRRAIRDKKVVLINASREQMGEALTIFGRYFIAQIGQEIFARDGSAHPVYFYMDEAHEYLADTPIVRRLFEQGRKHKLALVVAHQTLSQLKPGVDEMLHGLTSIKYAGGLSASDTVKMAKELQVDPQTLKDTPKLSFTAFVRGVGDFTHTVPLRRLEKADQLSDEAVQEIRQANRDLYCYPIEQKLPDEPPEPEIDRKHAVSTAAMRPLRSFRFGLPASSSTGAVRADVRPACRRCGRSRRRAMPGGRCR